MRAILTPDVAPRTGTVILRPGNDLLWMFRGRVVVSMEPEYLKSVPSGRLHDSEQPLLDDPDLHLFWSHQRVISAAGGERALETYVAGLDCCQFVADEYHHHHHTTLKTEHGYLCLCYTHDNHFRDVHVPDQLHAVAMQNTAEFVIRKVVSDLSLPAGHLLSMPELCWWALTKGITDLIPEVPGRRLFKMPPAKELRGTMKESDIVGYDDSAAAVMERTAEKAKQVLRLNIDPESPESFMLKPKRRRWVNEKYTRWVKSQPCACCGQPADDPHHIIGHGQGGTGTKAHDIFVIPLCRAHHDELHRDPAAFESKYGSQLLLLLRILDHAFAVGVIGTDKK